MSVWGKLVGGAAGFAIGGPIGALIGALGGHFVDKARQAGETIAEELADNRGKMWRDGMESGDPKRIAWATAAVVLASKMAAADGKVTHDEIETFRRCYNVPARDMPMVRALFDQAGTDDPGIDPYTGQIRQMFADEPVIREELLDSLYRIAQADGVVDEKEVFFFRKVAFGLGFSEETFHRIHALNTESNRLSPYMVLGVASTADDRDVKAAYRRLVREHHPDRLIALGMPEEFIAQATEKLARINSAWETVRAERTLR